MVQGGNVDDGKQAICYLDNGKEFLLLLRNKKPNDVHEGQVHWRWWQTEAAETPGRMCRA